MNAVQHLIPSVTTPKPGVPGGIGGHDEAALQLRGPHTVRDAGGRGPHAVGRREEPHEDAAQVRAEVVAREDDEVAAEAVDAACRVAGRVGARAAPKAADK